MSDVTAVATMAPGNLPAPPPSFSPAPAAPVVSPLPSAAPAAVPTALAMPPSPPAMPEAAIPAPLSPLPAPPASPLPAKPADLPSTTTSGVTPSDVPTTLSKYGVELTDQLMQSALRAEAPELWQFSSQDKTGAVELGIETLVKQRLQAILNHKQQYHIADDVLTVVSGDGKAYVVPTAALKAMAQPSRPAAGSSADDLARQLVAEALRVQAANFSASTFEQTLQAAGYSAADFTAPILFTDDQGVPQPDRLGRLLRDRIIKQAVSAVLSGDSVAAVPPVGASAAA